MWQFDWGCHSQTTSFLYNPDKFVQVSSFAIAGLTSVYIKLTFTAEIPSEIYSQDCLAQLFYKELIFVKKNLTADVTTNVFRNFQSTFNKIGQESVCSSVASWATLVQREFLEDSKRSFSGWYQCMWHSFR